MCSGQTEDLFSFAKNQNDPSVFCGSHCKTFFHFSHGGWNASEVILAAFPDFQLPELVMPQSKKEIRRRRTGPEGGKGEGKKEDEQEEVQEQSKITQGRRSV